MAPTSKVQMHEIDAELAGQRLDNYLIKCLKGLPKSRIYRIVRKGEVRINGKRSKPETKLVAGDIVRIPPIQHLPERSTAVGHFNDLESLIVHEDDYLLIINKPAGMAVHGGSGVNVGVIESLRHARAEGNRLELVHRLDRGTSGCLMVSKRRSYLRLLQDALRQPGQIRKHYLAMVHGRWPGKISQIEQPLLTSSIGGKERVTRVNGQGKYAATDFSVIEANDELSLVRASPRTGRTHQIRVHARWARHPLVGDTRYGDQTLDQAAGIEGRLMLHAAELRIPGLGDRPPIHARAPVDHDFLLKVNSRFSKKDLNIQ